MGMGCSGGSDAAASNLHKGSDGQNLICGQSEATEEEPIFLAKSIISERPISVTSAKNNVAISAGETPKNWLDEGLLENVSEQTTSICGFFEQHVEKSHMEPQVSEESCEDDKVEASSEELTDFSDIEYNLDSEDLFCDDGDIEKVKKHVEHSLRDLGILGAETMNRDEFEFSAESDELLTASESSDDDQCTPQNKYPYFNEKTGFCKEIVLDKGIQFRNKHIFNKALRYYAVMKGFDFYYVSNSKVKVSAHCPWRVLASWFNDGNGSRSFMTKTWVPHKDKGCPRRFENSKVSVQFLTKHYLEGFRNNPKWEASAFFKHVKADLEVNVSRTKCFRARQNALKIIDGSVSEQFKLLRQYCGALLKWCPGSTILLKTDGPHFQRIYICLDACKRGFLTGCRPIISLDSCKDEPTDPKKAADGAKEAARKKVSRQLKKARLEGPQQVKSNPSPPKKPKDRRKCKDPQPSRMRENQVSNQVPPVSEWTMGYEKSTSVVTYRPPRREGPIFINGGVFTSQKQS